MYISEEGITDKARMTMQPPFGPGFTQTQADRAATMTVAHSSFRDEGDDYTIFILKDSEGKAIEQTKVEGY
jgi:hypothetical protein